MPVAADPTSGARNAQDRVAAVRDERFRSVLSWGLLLAGDPAPDSSRAALTPEAVARSVPRAQQPPSFGL